MRGFGESGETRYQDSTSGDKKGAQSSATSERLMEEKCSHQGVEDETRGLQSTEQR